jgi:hypothetical protein
MAMARGEVQFTLSRMRIISNADHIQSGSYRCDVETMMITRQARIAQMMGGILQKIETREPCDISSHTSSPQRVGQQREARTDEWTCAGEEVFERAIHSNPFKRKKQQQKRECVCASPKKGGPRPSLCLRGCGVGDDLSLPPPSPWERGFLGLLSATSEGPKQEPRFLAFRSAGEKRACSVMERCHGTSGDVF